MPQPGFSTALLVAPSHLEGLRLRQVLLRCGLARVLVAEGQARALSLLEEEAVELILAPWETPDFSARALLRALRKKGRHKKVPLLILDAGLAPETMVAAIKAGAAGRVPLPPGRERLAEALRALGEGWRPPG